MGLKAVVCKRFTFDAAHQLPNHSGKCKHLHGHTYQVEVYLFGEVNNTPGASDEGMVVDFGVVKDVFKRRVESVCDHQNLNKVLPFRTTAENIARWILEEMRKELPQVIKVRVYETPTSFVEVFEHHI